MSDERRSPGMITIPDSDGDHRKILDDEYLDMPARSL